MIYQSNQDEPIITLQLVALSLFDDDTESDRKCSEDGKHCYDRVVEDLLVGCKINARRRISI